jgi:hypothetical protein
VNQSAIPVIDGERWLPVPGYEGRYEVSSRGRVWSSPRKTITGVRGGLLLKAVLAGRPGYERLAVTLCRGTEKNQCRVHQLVMLAFVGPCPEGMEVLHLDGDRFRNHWPENLAYGDHATNQRQMVEHGTAHLALKVGSQRLNAKLTEETVPVIRAEYAAGGVTERDLSAKYGINVSTLHRMLVRQTWKHVA